MGQDWSLAGQGNSDVDAVPLRQAKTLRNPFSLQRKSLKLKRVDADTIHLSFKFDAIEECKVSSHTLWRKS